MPFVIFDGDAPTQWVAQPKPGVLQSACMRRRPSGSLRPSRQVIRSSRRGISEIHWDNRNAEEATLISHDPVFAHYPVKAGYGVLAQGLRGFTEVLVISFDAAATMVFEGLIAQRVRVGTMDL